MKMHQGLLPFSGGQAEEWLLAAQKLQGIAEGNGAKFLVFIAPNKHEIYGEHLSSYPVRLHGPRRSEVLRRLGPEFSVTVVYPEAELLAAKANAQVYYKTDTHWSSAGAFVGYEVLIDAVNQMGFPVDKIDREAQISISENSHKGDIYGLLGLTDEAAETTSEWKLKVPRAFEKELLPDYDWLSFKAFRNTVHDTTGPSVLVIGDSFAGAMQPFLRESFSEVTFVHHRIGDIPIAAFNAGAYDLVVLQMVERGLSRELQPQFPDEP